MASPPSPTEARQTTGRHRGNSVTQSIASVSNSVVSRTEDIVLNHDPPLGFFAATAQATSKAPSLGNIRRGSFSEGGWQSVALQRQSVEERRQSVHGGPEVLSPVTEESLSSATPGGTQALQVEKKSDTTLQIGETNATSEHERTDHDRIGDNEGAAPPEYSPLTKQSWTTSTFIGLKAFWKWFTTPFGFFVTLYGLNVVAWGGMLFLLLCNASPAMCHAPIPTPENQKHMSPATALDLPGPYYFNCSDINSPRRIWLEIDSQILNALFCVTGLGLIPWRFRDLYYLLLWRFTSEEKHGKQRKMYGLRVLAGIHRGWFRLPDSDTLIAIPAMDHPTPATGHAQTHEGDTTLDRVPTTMFAAPEDDLRLPLPPAKTPDDPLTGIRAPPTKLWKLDFFVWCFVWNTFLQFCLCGFMWGLNRYARPSWSTGLFVGLACVVAAVGGLTSFLEGKRIKKIEIVAPTEKDLEKQGGNEVAGTELDHGAKSTTERESVRANEKTSRGNS